MILVEVLEKSPRFQNFIPEESNKGIRTNLDLLEEVHDRAHLHSEALKRRVKLRYKTKIKPQQFRVSNLVLRKAHLYQIENKLSAHIE